MSLFHAIKQLEEKNVANEINIMVWSDRMDLVAFSTIKGEVALHRLTWTRAWSLTPPTEGLTVKSIAWRPDGKLLAVGYSNGQVLLISVENKSILNTIDTNGDITGTYWIQEKVEMKARNPSLVNVNDEEDGNNYMKYIDYSSTFLLEPPLVSNFDTALNSSEETKKGNILHEQSEFNLLIIGTKEGFIHFDIFGCFPCSTINLVEYLGYKCSVENIHLTEDLAKLFITVKDVDDNLKLVVMDCSIFKTHTKELFAVALKYVRLNHIVNYLSSTITTITETWENILLEMDNKLSKYASRVAQGGVTADFLDLLMFGICSSEMEEFLMKDLTKKGLEKFGQSIEMSYSNIQKLLLKYVTKFGQNVTYHLAELRGMARLEYRYKVIALCEDNITEAIRSSGSFLIKAGEMQQIMNQSIINYKAFFRWLYTAIMHLMNEQIPPEIPKMTQQDLAYITEFLQNFDHIGNTSGEKGGGFIMERLGQYLADAPLSIPPKMNENEWTDFLSENNCIREHPSIFKHFENYSLVQQFKHFKSSIESIFVRPQEQIKQQFNLIKIFNCCNQSSNVKMSQVNISTDTVLFSFIQPHEQINLVQIVLNELDCVVKYGKVHFPQYLSSVQASPRNNGNYHVVDAKFYSSTILTVLLHENPSRAALLYHFPIVMCLDNLDEISPNSIFFQDELKGSINGCNVSPKVFKSIDMPASQFAVSGSRRVSIVLAENKRKVKLFEMEGEEEEDDAEMSTLSISREGDFSMQQEYA